MKSDRLDAQMNFRSTRAEWVRVQQMAQREDCGCARVIRRLFRRGLAIETGAKHRKVSA